MKMGILGTTESLLGYWVKVTLIPSTLMTVEKIICPCMLMTKKLPSSKLPLKMCNDYHDMGPDS